LNLILNNAFNIQANFQNRLGFLQELLNFERIPIAKTFINNLPWQLF